MNFTRLSFLAFGVFITSSCVPDAAADSFYGEGLYGWYEGGPAVVEDTKIRDFFGETVSTGQVIDLCRENGIPVYERNFSLVDTYGADEAFLTGTFGAQTPVGIIDGRQIGTGQMGPMTERLRGLYKALIARS